MTASRAYRRGPSPSPAADEDGPGGRVPTDRPWPAEVAVNEPLRLRSTVPADPSWASRVRRLVSDHLTVLRLPSEQLDSAVLMTDELFANAVKYASPDPRDTVTVTIEWTERTLRVSIADRSPVLPRRRTADAAAESGRGLAIVTALADDWGVTRPAPGARGKRVWFTLVRQGAEP